MGLFDQAGNEISSDFATVVDAKEVLHREGETVTIGHEDYIAVQKQSEATGWNLVILTPVDYTTEGISVRGPRSSYPGRGCAAVPVLKLYIDHDDHPADFESDQSHARRETGNAEAHCRHLEDDGDQRA